MGGCFGGQNSHSVRNKSTRCGEKAKSIITLEREPANVEKSGKSDPSDGSKVKYYTDSQKTAARLFSEDVAKLFRGESGCINLHSPRSDFDVQIACNSQDIPTILSGEQSDSSDAVNPKISENFRRSSGQPSVCLWSRESSGLVWDSCLPADRLSWAKTTKKLDSVGQPQLVNIESVNGFSDNETENLICQGLNDESSTDVLKIRQIEKIENRKNSNSDFFSIEPVSSSDQLFEDNSLVMVPLPETDTVHHDVNAPRQKNSISPSADTADDSIILDLEQSVSPDVISPVESPVVPIDSPSSGINIVGNSHRLRTCALNTYVHPLKTPATSVEVDEKSLILVSFDRRKARIPLVRGSSVDNDLSMTDRITEMPINDQVGTVFDDVDSSSDPIDFGNNEQMHRATDQNSSASDRISFEKENGGYNSPFRNDDESSSNPVDFVTSVENLNMVEARKGSTVRQAIPAFTNESSSEIPIKARNHRKR